MGTEIIVAFLSGSSVVALINLFKWWVVRKDKKAESTIPDVLGKIHEVYRILNLILHETPAQLVHLVRVENGGAVPKVGKDLYASVVYEVTDRKRVGVKDKYQKEPIQEEFVTMLLGVAEKGYVYHSASNIPSSVIKDFLLAQDLTGTGFMKIKVRDGAFFYLAIYYRSDNETDPDNPALRNLLRFCARELEKLID